MMTKVVAAEEFKARRNTLAQQLSTNSIAVVSTSAIRYRNSDVEYPYRADSYFHYLTGFNEPEAILLIETFESDQPYDYTLFCRERNHDEEIWNGYRVGLEGAVQEYFADQSYLIDKFDEQCGTRLLGKSNIYLCLGHDDTLEQRVLDILQQASGENSVTPLPLNPILDEMRLFKSAFEIECMKKAAAITAKAHTHAMQAAYNGVMEYELAAELHYQFNKNGCEPAYGTIVAGGENACVLHYVENNQPIAPNDLVLIDAGCEYQYYASDISRTFPVSGQFSAEQRALYQLVLDAQYAAIDAVQVGASFIAPHNATVQILTQGLVELGLLTGNVDELIQTQAYTKFYMHGTSHWLGLDVHDVGTYKIDGVYRNFEAGMVLTIEPGLYIAKDEPSVAEKWRGIGIRIEDNIFVTIGGAEVLTAAVVKDIDAIESLMKNKNI